MSSIRFKNVFIKNYYSVAGPLESRGKLKGINEKLDDYYFKEKTFERAEIKMQQKVIDGILKNNNLSDNEISALIGGDLINQISISSYSARDYNFPFLGVYSACSTFVQSLLMGAMLVDGYKYNNVLAITSSHNLTAERQYRYPVEYGAPKRKTTTFTTTGSVGALLTNKMTNIKLECATIGKVIDKGINDVSNMGAVMAPAASDTLQRHLKEFNRDINYYDLILTGDLGCVGATIFKEYTKKVFKINIKKHMDAGCEIFLDSEEVYAGGSGPVCLPLVLFHKVLKSKKYKKILILGTGSLHSVNLINQHNTIPAISHAVSLEVLS